MNRVETHRSVKLDGLVHLPRETIDQEPSLSILPPDRLGRVVDRLPHGVLQELSGEHIRPADVNTMILT
jgi:hypothetical protein